MSETVTHDATPRVDTRARIQAVAVELFSEQGYDKTSLREIAERLDVTKAALYYHFKSKEDIIRSLIDDYFGELDGLVAWARQAPMTPARRAELLSRYLDMVIGRQHVYRMMQQNQAALASLTSRKYHGEMFKERTHAIIDVLAEPGAPLPERVRAGAAVTSVSICWMLFHDNVEDICELHKIILSLATELTDSAS
jgi:AcrR family transcriptional regulator